MSEDRRADLDGVAAQGAGAGIAAGDAVTGRSASSQPGPSLVMLGGGVTAALTGTGAMGAAHLVAPWPVVVALLALSVGTVAATAWGRRRGRLRPPASVRAAVVARLLLAWSLCLSYFAAVVLVFGGSGASWNLQLLIVQSFVVSVVFAQARSNRQAPIDPGARRPGSHLSRRERRAIAVGIRNGGVFAAERDGDVRAVIHRVLDRELAGWASLAAAVVGLGTIAWTVPPVSSWFLAVLLIAGIVLGVIGWCILAAVRAAKRHQVWLNPAPPRSPPRAPARTAPIARHGSDPQRARTGSPA